MASALATARSELFQAVRDFGADRDSSKPYEFIGFGAMEVTKPYGFIGFWAMEVTKPYEFIGFGTQRDSSIFWDLGHPESKNDDLRSATKPRKLETGFLKAIWQGFLGVHF